MAKKKEAQAEPDNDEAEEGKEAPAKRKFSLKLPSRKILLMGIGGLVAMLAIGGGGYFFFLSGHGHAEAATSASGAAAQSKPVVFLDLPDVLVNLSGGSGERT